MNTYLGEYKLELNTKTRIESLSDKDMHWTEKLNQFNFPPTSSRKINFTSCKTYLDLALSLTKAENIVSPLKYAIKVLQVKGGKGELNSRAILNTLTTVFALCLEYPYLCSSIEDLRNVFNKHIENEEHANKLKAREQDFIHMLIEHGLSLSSTDALAYGLYFAYQFKVDLKTLLGKDKIIKICDLQDCISLVLLYEYINLYPIQNKSDMKRQLIKLAEEKNNADDERDKFWLLIYTVLDSKKIKDPFLRELKTTGFSFIDWTRQGN